MKQYLWLAGRSRIFLKTHEQETQRKACLVAIEFVGWLKIAETEKIVLNLHMFVQPFSITEFLTENGKAFGRRVSAGEALSSARTGKKEKIKAKTSFRSAKTCSTDVLEMLASMERVICKMISLGL